MSDTTPQGGLAPLPTPVPTQTAQTPYIPLPEPEPIVQAPAFKKKLFTLGDAIPTVPARVHLPYLYPDYEPWGFVFRTSLSKEAEEKRNAFLALPPSKQALGEEDEILNECADLLAEDPTGFGDWPEGLMSPGDKLKLYYQRAKENPITYPLVKSILVSANNMYWASVTPREFFPPTTDNRP